MVVDDLLINMPRILEYFVPGYMAIFTYRRLKNSDNDSIPEAIHIGACVVISYLLKGFLKIIWNCDFISSLFSFAQSDLYLRCISLSIFPLSESYLTPYITPVYQKVYLNCAIWKTPQI